MKPVCLLMLLFTLMLACSPSKKEDEKADQGPAFDSLLAQYHEERFKFYPLDATLAGDNRYNDTLPNDISSDYREALRIFYARYREQLESFDRNILTENQRLSYDVLLRECDINTAGLAFKDYLMPINQFSSLPLYIGQMASGQSFQPFKTVKDYENWLSRLDDYLAWCDTAIVNMKKGKKEGYVLPKALAKKIVPQFKNFDHGPVESHLFYAPVKNIPADFSGEDKERITKSYADFITNRIIPTYKELSQFLEKEYLPSCRESSGISALPNGKELYTHLIRYYTTTNSSPEEIFELGKSEVDRITKEMETVKEQVGFRGDLKSFFVHLRTMKELTPFTSADQVIAHFNDIHERMKPNLEKLFDKKPKTPFEVRRTEAFREASASAEYNPGSLDGTRPGIFYVPVPDAKKYNILSDEDLFLHEAIPGHHYQISLMQENKDLPAFRKLLYNSAYVEGWALYTESLGKELGLYTDPYQYFGMLSAEMHRAIRLVVDAGMHTQGWTREQAILYSLDHEAETEDDVVPEIERYMAIPGQALSYKIGQLKIRALRTKAENELGDKFVIGQFHNQILDSGSLPLNVLEDKVDRWIASLKTPVENANQ
ncbi:MAG TPA: DUF885 domain-containing protein [Cyclobacteriaceae bacterium]|nr:DUF885 domain-containing protein [Cyclobacteriaceae bacterium]